MQYWLDVLCIIALVAEKSIVVTKDCGRAGTGRTLEG